MRRRESFVWKPSLRDGSLGPPGRYEVYTEDLDWAQRLYESGAADEARFFLDAFALLAAHLVDPPVEPPPPSVPRFVDEAAALHDLVDGWDMDPERAPLWAQESLLPA